MRQTAKAREDEEDLGDSEEEEPGSEQPEEEQVEEEQDRLSDGDGANSQAEEDEEAEEEEQEDNPEGAEEHPMTQEDIREANVKALKTNTGLQVSRQPAMSSLMLKESERILKRAFISPCPGAPALSEDMKRKLLARKIFTPWGSNRPVMPQIIPRVLPPEEAPQPPPPPPDALPEGIEPLVLWAPPEGAPGAAISVDTMLVRWLRPHQREGVQFMFDCVTGQRVQGGQGCILADDMGLGKTLQGISLLWTLLQGGHELLGGQPLAQRVIIVCPTSLVSNWDSECTKWLKGRLTTMPLCEASREDVIAGITSYLSSRNHAKVLIISYETFRLHAERLQGPGACDLLICDEAHRLKNDATLTNKALGALPCRRRVLLSGTPMQNHLDEFYAMVDFCNPGVLGTPSQFRKRFEAPILAGREPGASAAVQERGQERSAELSTLVNAFILRRTNALLSQHLPPKVVQVVCCRLTVLQQLLYDHFLQSKATHKLLTKQGTAGVLSAITSLKKLCNHPKLIYDAVHSGGSGGAQGGKKKAAAGGEEALAAGFKNVGDLFPPGVFDAGRVGRGGMAHGWETLSGKMAVLARMLHILHYETRDRIVVVSNYTQTLDLIAQLCRERGYPFLRLDGSTGISKRQKLVKAFNDLQDRQFVFLLSSKAGGCGLNLVGGNRLVLFDPDWNPANDKQAAGRVWRDGQKKHVYVYRFLSSGSIEEKVFQRQLSKEGLQSLVSKNGKATAAMMSAQELRELFRLQADSMSTTYESMCSNKQQQQEQQGQEEEAEEEQEEALTLELGEDDEEETRAAGNPGGGGTEGGKEHGAEATAAGQAEAEAEAAAAAQPVKKQVFKAQEGTPSEEDLRRWGHHSSATTVPDIVMQRAAGEEVSFIFTCEVEGKAPEMASGPVPGASSRSQPMQPSSSGAAAPFGGRPSLGLRGGALHNSAAAAGPSTSGSGVSAQAQAPAVIVAARPSGSGAGPSGRSALEGVQRENQPLPTAAAKPLICKRPATAPAPPKRPGPAHPSSTTTPAPETSGASTAVPAAAGAQQDHQGAAPKRARLAVGTARAAAPPPEEVLVLDSSGSEEE